MLHQQEQATKAVLNAEESERRRIAAELHDGVGQLMSAARMNLESVLYRIKQECVTNVIKHSGASQLDIVLLKENNHIDVTIEDNGKGFVVEEAYNGIGLQNIRVRIQYLKGTLDIESAPGRGSFFGIHIPL